mgnify:CR=1 FL=1|jgi:hypothetical protein
MTDWYEAKETQTEDTKTESDGEKLSPIGMAAVQGVSDSQIIEQEHQGLDADIAQAEEAKAEAIKQAEAALKGGRSDAAERALEVAKDADRAASSMRMEQLQNQMPPATSVDEVSQDESPNAAPPPEYRPKPAFGEAAMVERAETDAEKGEREIYLHNPEGKSYR